jgi:hypothetical protein
VPDSVNPDGATNRENNSVALFGYFGMMKIACLDFGTCRRIVTL